MGRKGGLFKFPWCFPLNISGAIGRRIFLFFFLVQFATACGYPEPPKRISVSNLESFRPASPREITSVQQALAAVVTVCRDDLKLPAVQNFEASLYKNSQSFASYGVDWRMFPTDVAHVAAFASGPKIHIDLQKVNDGSGWANFTRLLAHEFGHTIHHEVSGVIPATDTWFNEGFAEWVAARVLDTLGWRDYDSLIDWAKKDVARLIDIVPPLMKLRSVHDWQRAMTGNYGMIRTYSFGLVAVDRLLQRQKLTSAIPLLSATTFNDAFGGSYEQFDQELRNHLRGYQPKPNSFETVKAPIWTNGDKWTHEIRRPGYLTSTTEKQFVGNEFFVGVPSYVLKSGSEEWLYSIDSLSLMARRRNGKHSYRVSNDEQRLSWPLRPQKEWLSRFTRDDADIGTARTVRQVLRAIGVEDVKVKGGRFRAIGYGYNSGRLIAEHWYSPQVKWFVRSRIYYRDFGLVEEELVNFDVQ